MSKTVCYDCLEFVSQAVYKKVKDRVVQLLPAGNHCSYCDLREKGNLPKQVSHAAS